MSFVFPLCSTFPPNFIKFSSIVFADLQTNNENTSFEEDQAEKKVHTAQQKNASKTTCEAKSFVEVNSEINNRKLVADGKKCLLQFLKFEIF